MENTRTRIEKYKREPFAIETEDLIILLIEVLTEISDHLDGIKENTKSKILG